VSNATLPKQTVSVEIAGQRLRLSAHADPEHIERLAGMVNERVETIQRAARGAGTPTILALLALDLADELHATRRRAEESQSRAKDELERARAHAAQVEHSAREAIAEVLAEIDRALVVEEG
jgi:cell division protein ZapA (FtsZ GTPase activity inhibitor)